MRKLITIFSLGSLLAGFPGMVQSQGQTDSLSSYLRIAAKNNPVVQQRFTEYKAALERIPQVSTLPDPELGIDAFLNPMELVGGNQLADFSLMQMFPWFGTLRAAKDEMSLMAKAGFESFREARLKVLYDVHVKWNELYNVQQDIRISEKSLGILKTLERLSLARFRSGSTGASAMTGDQMGSGGSGLSDLYRIQIEVGEMENYIALLQSRQRTLTATFNSLINRPSMVSISVPDTMSVDTISLPFTAVRDSILLNNPMIVMLDYEKQSLEARKDMVTRMGYPMIGLGLNYSLISQNGTSTSMMNGKDMVMPMAKITLPLYRKKYRAMQNEASLLKSAAGYSQEAASNSLETEFYAALQQYQDAQRRVRLYTNQVYLTNRSLSIMMKSFSSSGAGLTEILQIRQQTLDYELKYVEAATDCNTSIAKLRQLMASDQIF